MTFRDAASLNFLIILGYWTFGFRNVSVHNKIFPVIFLQCTIHITHYTEVYMYIYKHSGDYQF